MKALVGSLAAVALLCLFILIRSSFAQPNDYICDLAVNGCGGTLFCYQASGECSNDTSEAFEAFDQIGADATYCAWSSEESCYNNIEYIICKYKYYATYEDDMCSDQISGCEPEDIWDNVCSDEGD